MIAQEEVFCKRQDDIHQRSKISSENSFLLINNLSFMWARCLCPLYWVVWTNLLACWWSNYFLTGFHDQFCRASHASSIWFELLRNYRIYSEVFIKTDNRLCYPPGCSSLNSTVTRNGESRIIYKSILGNHDRCLSLPYRKSWKVHLICCWWCTNKE